jgi:hypothetical protein
MEMALMHSPALSNRSTRGPRKALPILTLSITGCEGPSHDSSLGETGRQEYMAARGVKLVGGERRGSPGACVMVSLVCDGF